MTKVVKLHELIPVEESRKTTADLISKETKSTFKNKQAHFTGHIRKYESIDENYGTFDDEVSHVVTSVPEKLAHFEKSVVACLDTIFSKEKSNTVAKSDIIIREENEDIVIANDVPIHAIVQILNLLISYRDMVYNNILTLDPKNAWIPDTDRGPGYYKTEESKKRKTTKDESFVIVTEATEHHKAQYEKVTRDIQIGNWIDTSFSGMMTPADKSTLLERLGKLIEAFKQAKGRANQADAVLDKIGGKIFNYINKGTV